MTPDEHYTEAERLLHVSEHDPNLYDDWDRINWLTARAHVHAILATANPTRPTPRLEATYRPATTTDPLATIADQFDRLGRDDDGDEPRIPA